MVNLLIVTAVFLLLVVATNCSMVMPLSEWLSEDPECFVHINRTVVISATTSGSTTGSKIVISDIMAPSDLKKRKEVVVFAPAGLDLSNLSDQLDGKVKKDRRLIICQSSKKGLKSMKKFKEIKCSSGKHKIIQKGKIYKLCNLRTGSCFKVMKGVTTQGKITIYRIDVAVPTSRPTTATK